MDRKTTITIGAITFAAATSGRGALRQPEEGTPLFAAGFVNSVAEDPFVNQADLTEATDPFAQPGFVRSSTRS
jgi:hypothetical protein